MIVIVEPTFSMPTYQWSHCGNQRSCPPLRQACPGQWPVHVAQLELEDGVNSKFSGSECGLPSGKNVALHYTFQSVLPSSSSKTQELRCALKCNHTIDVGLVIRHCNLLPIDFNMCYSNFAVESSSKKTYNWDPQKSPPKYINWNWNEHTLSTMEQMPSPPEARTWKTHISVAAFARWQGKSEWRQVCVCRKQQQ